jgi:hypothetical protein
LLGFGQEWTFGGTSSDESRSVQQTTDGGYIITGWTPGSGNGASNVYLIKTDGSGIAQWSKTFGDGGERGYSVQHTTDGGYIIVGRDGNEVYLIKTDANGIEQWSKKFSGIMGKSVQQTTDGGYIITGLSNVGGSDIVILIKTDANGIEQWSKTFGGTSWGDEGRSVQQTTDGGYIITGTTTSFGNGGIDVYLIKTDGNGDSLWTKTFGGTDDDEGYSVQQTSDGGYIITGNTEGFGLGSEYVYLIKTDGSGIEQWSKTFGGTGNEGGRSVQQTTDGGYIITGFATSFGNGGMDVYLIKTDGSGIEQWSKTFGGTGNDWGHSVQQTTDGGYIITGATTSFGNGNSDVYLIKTNSQGNITSTFNIPIPSSNRKLQKTVDILGRETKGTNQPLFYIYDDGTVEKRITIE